MSRNQYQNEITFNNKEDYQKSLKLLTRLTNDLGIFEIVKLSDDFIDIQLLSDEQDNNIIHLERNNPNLNIDTLTLDHGINNDLKVGQWIIYEGQWQGKLECLEFSLYKDKSIPEIDIVFNFNNIVNEKENYKINNDGTLKQIMDQDEWREDRWGSTSYPIYCDYDNDNLKIYFDTLSYTNCYPLIQNMVDKLSLNSVQYYVESDQDDYGGSNIEVKHS